MALSEIYNPEPPVKKDIEYFYLEPKQLVVLSIVTLGFYDLYWFYRNWQAVAKTEQVKIVPASRALFAVFYCYSLFKKILESATKHGFVEEYSAKLLAGGYIFILIVSSIVSQISELESISDFTYLYIGLFWLVFSNLTVIPMYLIQKAINYNNSKINPNYQSAPRFGGGEIFFIIVGIVFFILSVLSTVSMFIPE